MTKNALTVENRARAAWDKAVVCLTKIRQSSVVRPTGSEIFKVTTNEDDQEIKLSANPIVFKVSERPGNPVPNLYIVVEGWITFADQAGQIASFQTTDFGTKVAYFRHKNNRFNHIFGVHYDMDKRDYRHPVFHAQLNSFTSYINHVEDLFPQECQLDDSMGGVLRSVRIPTAQMDVFSVLIQICADHLIGQQPAPATTTAFESMRSAASFFIGAGSMINYLSNPPAASCFRSYHWYNT